MIFESLDLNGDILDALYDMHFDQCTPIQEKCIPEILKGKEQAKLPHTCFRYFQNSPMEVILKIQ